MLTKERLEELRHVIKETPADFTFWPTHFAGCVPHVTVDTPEIPRLDFYVKQVTVDGPYHTAERAIKYARRLAVSAQHLPEALDTIDAQALLIERLMKALEPFSAPDTLIFDGDQRKPMSFLTRDVLEARAALDEAKTFLR